MLATWMFPAVAFLLLAFGSPRQIHGGWEGYGVLVTWHVSRNQHGWYASVWTDPQRTGMPVELAFSIKTP